MAAHDPLYFAHHDQPLLRSLWGTPDKNLKEHLFGDHLSRGTFPILSRDPNLSRKPPEKKGQTDPALGKNDG